MGISAWECEAPAELRKRARHPGACEAPAELRKRARHPGACEADEKLALMNTSIPANSVARLLPLESVSAPYCDCGRMEGADKETMKAGKNGSEISLDRSRSAAIRSQARPWKGRRDRC
jgi:hypothetical protein